MGDGSEMPRALLCFALRDREAEAELEAELDDARFTLGNGRALIDRTLHKIKVPRIHRQLLKPLATNTGQQ